MILFGLDESKDFEIVGVYDLQDLQKKVTEQCNQMIPPVRAVFTTAELDGKYLCAVASQTIFRTWSIPAARSFCLYSSRGIRNTSPSSEPFNVPLNRSAGTGSPLLR